jgi:hypothetical protein
MTKKGRGGETESGRGRIGHAGVLEDLQIQEAGGALQVAIAPSAGQRETHQMS